MGRGSAGVGAREVGPAGRGPVAPRKASSLNILETFRGIFVLAFVLALFLFWAFKPLG